MIEYERSCLYSSNNELHLTDESLEVINSCLHVCIENLRNLGFLNGAKSFHEYSEDIISLGKQMSNLNTDFIEDIRVHQDQEFFGPDEFMDVEEDELQNAELLNDLSK